MSDLFELAMPWWEFVLRACVVYLVILALVRITGKRTVGQHTPFDLIVVVLLGTAVQNSLIGEDVSLLGGLILAATLIGLNWLVGIATSRSPLADRLVQGEPVLLARNGEVFERVLRRQMIPPSDLEEAMRAANVRERAQIEAAWLEPNGAITVLKLRD
ncbi:MAG: DUF421 domain-containing protein [Gammaproteobacteria bacterium]|jgi:uncharacterized membrane protein YcaP (DUF421 family)